MVQSLGEQSASVQCHMYFALPRQATTTGRADGPVQIARFLFAEDYEIEVRPNGLWLQRKGDPAVLGRSIGRLGLEQRLGRPD